MERCVVCCFKTRGQGSHTFCLERRFERACIANKVGKLAATSLLKLHLDAFPLSYTTYLVTGSGLECPKRIADRVNVNR